MTLDELNESAHKALEDWERARKGVETPEQAKQAMEHVERYIALHDRMTIAKLNKGLKALGGNTVALVLSVSASPLEQGSMQSPPIVPRETWEDSAEAGERPEA